ncbi:hypothetical protein GpartN1_g5683.t1 [Galdieria partita]|uniref:RNB domain-containing protein n=1 Tax=Galdieria partita TaxID=83374 RepID=A0A9C7Q1N1_9RHOD|nr:hypothetical protein GpartN1_g5683.t1 [Galdieria partita]
MFVEFIRWLPRVGKWRNFYVYDKIITCHSHTVSRTFVGFDLRSATVSPKCLGPSCILLSQQYSEVNTSLNTRTGICKCQEHLDHGTLLQFRKPEDDWLHWGIILSREEEKYRILSIDGGVYEVNYKQVHALSMTFSLENEPVLEKFVAKVSDSYHERQECQDRRIVNKWKILEKFFAMRISKSPELLSDLREIFQRYILLLNERHIVPSTHVWRNANYGKKTILRKLQEQPFSEEQAALRDEIVHASNKSFEEAIICLERDSLRLVDKQRSEDPLAMKILKTLQRPISPMASFQCLVELGYYNYYENLFLRASRFSEGFHENVLKAGDEILQHWKDLYDNRDMSLSRIELKQYFCYSIDDSDTIEIDDAVGLDGLDADYVWVHVADTSAYISVEDLLFDEALRRGSSIYLPTEKIGMFPMNVAELLLSLGSRYGSNYALSFGFRILPDGKLQDIQICKSIIKAPTRINYATVDKVISGDVVDSSLRDTDRICLQRLYELAKRRRAYRLANGAVEFNVNEAEVKVTFDYAEQPSFQFRNQTSESNSSLLVKEMMLAAGEAVAIHAQSRGWILPFRGQEMVNLPTETELNAIPEGVARFNKLLKFMKPSFISYRPTIHSSLGLPCYMQVTSPIRRAIDLLGHYQISNYLETNMPLMSIDQLSSRIKLAHEGAKEARIVKKRSLKYWCLEYLRMNGLGKSYPATVVSWIKREEPKRVLVQIDKIPYYFMTECDNIYHPGQQVVVRVTDVHPRLGMIRLNIVLEESP